MNNGIVSASTKGVKYNRKITIIRGLIPEELAEWLKVLKSRFGCGGYIKDNNICLQGDHIKKIKDMDLW